MKTIIIDSERSKTYLYNLIKEMPVDSTCEVITKKVDKSPTAKQRRLQWLWYTEVAASGLGRDDSKDEAHITAKWQFCRPILLRDDEMFGVIYNHFVSVIRDGDPETQRLKAREFSDKYISTEGLTRVQRVEYLREFERFWVGKGVELTDPGTQGVDLKRQNPMERAA